MWGSCLVGCCERRKTPAQRRQGELGDENDCSSTDEEQETFEIPGEWQSKGEKKGRRDDKDMGGGSIDNGDGAIRMDKKKRRSSKRVLKIERVEERDTDYSLDTPSPPPTPATGRFEYRPYRRSLTIENTPSPSNRRGSLFSRP